MLQLADTNVLARYLLRDDPKQSAEAEDFFQQAQSKSIYLPDPVLMELGFVLLGYYKIPKGRVVETLTALIRSDKFVLDFEMLNSTLCVFAENNISLIDSYIVAQNKVGDVGKVKTFDQKLQRVIKKQEPRF